MNALSVRDLPAALFGSAVARHAALTRWDAALRQSVSGSRRIGFVSVEPGAGATTLAEQVLRAVTARRSDSVLAVDVSAGGAGLASRLGVSPVPIDEGRVRARSTAEAVRGLAAGNGWVALRPNVVESAVAGWLDEAAPITRFFDVTLTDFGARSPRVDLAAAAALCDVVCLVSDSTRGSAELARGMAPAIEALPAESSK